MRGARRTEEKEKARRGDYRGPYTDLWGTPPLRVYTGCLYHYLRSMRSRIWDLNIQSGKVHLDFKGETES